MIWSLCRFQRDKSEAAEGGGLVQHVRTHSYSGKPVSRGGYQALRILVLLVLASLAACQIAPRGESQVLSVAVVSSSKAESFKQVADRLKAKLGDRARLYTLQGNTESDQQLLQRLNGSARRQVIVIGLKASRWSKHLVGKQVVFCQVFNYRQYGLVAPNRKGVSAVPPPDQLFRKWKRLSPKLRSVLAITGPLHRAMLRQARHDARRHGVQLKHMVVRSDKEFVYTYKQNVDKYHGLWLLPDNRVLSRKAMHDVMSYSVKHGKQVMVFSPQLLQIGGLVSVSAIADDVAEQVYRRLQDGVGEPNIPGPAVTHLTRADIRINHVVARQLGLIENQPSN